MKTIEVNFSLQSREIVIFFMEGRILLRKFMSYKLLQNRTELNSTKLDQNLQRDQNRPKSSTGPKQTKVFNRTKTAQNRTRTGPKQDQTGPTASTASKQDRNRPKHPSLSERGDLKVRPAKICGLRTSGFGDLFGDGTRYSVRRDCTAMITGSEFATPRRAARVARSAVTVRPSRFRFDSSFATPVPCNSASSETIDTYSPLWFHDKMSGRKRMGQIEKMWLGKEEDNVPASNESESGEPQPDDSKTATVASENQIAEPLPPHQLRAVGACGTIPSQAMKGMGWMSANYKKSRRLASSVQDYQGQRSINSIYGYGVEKSFRTQDLNKYYLSQKNSSGLHAYGAYRRIPLTPQQRAATLQWCQERRQWVDEWDHIAFRGSLNAHHYIDEILEPAVLDFLETLPDREFNRIMSIHILEGLQ
ncbi:hypothetical protein GEV33_011061 [Tenebrio molitor]|uniref:Uncharacterized protein n=1 Tax=Tenebrio molitor TaxID=7067 RepID=A0A8J6HBP4_TENMO|nr:hypothetical protein GEV33_011061 [Tenebrio molitor]